MRRIASILILLAMCAVARGQMYSDGVANRYISFDGYEVELSGATGLTACAWFRWSGVKPASIMDIVFFPSLSSVAISLRLNSAGKLYSVSRVNDVSGHYTLTSPLSFPTNELVHIAVVCDYATGTRILYQNGVIVTNDSVSWGAGTTSYQDSGPIGGIGGQNDDPGRAFRGHIYMSQIFKRALSGSEIKSLADIDTAWVLNADDKLSLNWYISTNDTGTKIEGVARNYGTGADGTYSNSPTVAQPHVQTEKPLTMELP